MKEYIDYHSCRKKIREHSCRTSSGDRYGECKIFTFSGRTSIHCMISKDIKYLTPEQRKELNNVSSAEECMALRIKYGAPILAEFKYIPENKVSFRGEVNR